MPEPQTSPNGCRICGLGPRSHARQWKPPASWHPYEPPTESLIKLRMLARRQARLNAGPPIHHAATAWAPDPGGESAEPYCADCGSTACPRWNRIHDRLHLQRQGLRRWPRRSTPTGPWGGDQPWPF